MPQANADQSGIAEGLKNRVQQSAAIAEMRDNEEHPHQHLDSVSVRVHSARQSRSPASRAQGREGDIPTSTGHFDEDTEEVPQRRGFGSRNGPCYSQEG